MLGISYRDHRYDNYLNSQECLVHPTASFLREYKLLLRADLDTFPTPRYQHHDHIISDIL